MARKVQSPAARLKEAKGELLDQGSDLDSESENERTPPSQAASSTRRSSKPSESEYDGFSTDVTETPSERSAAPSRSQSDISNENEDRSDVEDAGPSNRWTGSKWRWLRYTKQERLIYESLVKERARDLGSHLYNVHAAKKRFREQRPEPAARDERSAGAAEDADDEDARSEAPSRPHRRKRRKLSKSWIHPGWTAWPMRLKDYPEPVFNERSDIADLARDARKDLEEILLGIIQKRARERLAQRQWVTERSTTTKDGEQSTSIIPDPSPPTPMIDDDYAQALFLPSIRNLLRSCEELVERLNISQRTESRTQHRRTYSDAAIKIEDEDEHTQTVDVASQEPISRKPPDRAAKQGPPKPLPEGWISVLSVAALKPDRSFTTTSLFRTKRRCEMIFNHQLPDTNLLNSLIPDPSSMDTSLSTSPVDTRAPIPTESRASRLIGRNIDRGGPQGNPHLIHSEATRQRLRGTEWTEEEDRILAQGIEEGKSFAEIVKGDGEGGRLLRERGRTRDSCKGRWRTIEKVRARVAKGDKAEEAEMWGGIRRDGFLCQVPIK